jgi:hypothetical protein
MTERDKNEDVRGADSSKPIAWPGLLYLAFLHLLPSSRYLRSRVRRWFLGREMAEYGSLEVPVRKATRRAILHMLLLAAIALGLAALIDPGPGALWWMRVCGVASIALAVRALVSWHDQGFWGADFTEHITRTWFGFWYSSGVFLTLLSLFCDRPS